MYLFIQSEELPFNLSHLIYLIVAYVCLPSVNIIIYVTFTFQK